MLELYELEHDVYVIVKTSEPVSVIEQLNESKSPDVEYLWRGTNKIIKRPISVELLLSLIPVMNTLFVIKDSGILAFNKKTINQREFRGILPRLVLES